MAKIIEEVQRPALILAHNKTLAAQLYHLSSKSFFPQNAVEYFVSYYDYYQRRSLHPSRRPLHRKGSHYQRGARWTSACAFCHPFPLRTPRLHHRILRLLHLRRRLPRSLPRHAPPPRARPENPSRRHHQAPGRNPLRSQRRRLPPRHLPRSRRTPSRSTPPYDENAYRIELFGDEIDALSQIDPLFGTRPLKKYSRLPIYPKVPLRRPARGAKPPPSTPSSPNSASGRPTPKGRPPGRESQRIHQHPLRPRNDQVRLFLPRHRKATPATSPAASPANPRPRSSTTSPATTSSSSTSPTSPSRSSTCGTATAPASRTSSTMDSEGFRRHMDNRPLKFWMSSSLHWPDHLRLRHLGPYELNTISAGVVVETNHPPPPASIDPQVEIRPVKGQIDDLLA